MNGAIKRAGSFRIHIYHFSTPNSVEANPYTYGGKYYDINDAAIYLLRATPPDSPRSRVIAPPNADPGKAALLRFPKGKLDTKCHHHLAQSIIPFQQGTNGGLPRGPDIRV